MDRCAKTIGRKKFSRLPAYRQHELLAELARDAAAAGDYGGFLARYHVMHTWAELDRYTPPGWLTAGEALEEYFHFHAGFGLRPGDADEGAPGEQPPGWQPVFPVTVVLDQVRSPYNVGSTLRLIDNFGLAGLVHATPGLRLTHPRLRRSARGAERWIPVRCVADLPGFLQQAAVPVIGIEDCPEAVAVESWQPPGACLLVAGNETYGIADSVRSCCSTMVRIPMYGFKKSMNVHQALAIAAHKIVNRKGLK